MQYCYSPLQVRTSVSYAGNFVRCRNTLSDINTLFKVEKTSKCYRLPTRLRKKITSLNIKEYALPNYTLTENRIHLKLI